jgi:hypothetical protein
VIQTTDKIRVLYILTFSVLQSHICNSSDRPHAHSPTKNTDPSVMTLGTAMPIPPVAELNLDYKV